MRIRDVGNVERLNESFVPAFPSVDAVVLHDPVAVAGRLDADDGAFVEKFFR